MSILIDKLTEGGWSVAVRKRTEGLILSDREAPFTLIPSTWRTWEADPFLFEHEGTVYVFAEMFDYITRRGGIGYARLDNGRWSRWKLVIDEPFHMSYPNVFQVGEDIFMIPETGADFTLRLYRAASFPDRWELVKVLARDVRWVDTTFWTEGDRLFAITRDEADWDNQRDLMLEFNDQFEILSITPFMESNLDFSRSGGNFVEQNGLHFRVTQDCSTHYGGGLNFSEFGGSHSHEGGMKPPALRLVADDLRLSKAACWTGLHTYNHSEHYEVVDVERRHFHVCGFLVRLFTKLKR